MIGEKFGLMMLALRTKMVFGKPADWLTVIIDYDRDTTQQIYHFTGEDKDTVIPEASFKDTVYANVVRRLFDQRKEDLGARTIHLCALKWDLRRYETDLVKIKFDMPDDSMWIFENLGGKINLRPSLQSLS